MDFSNAFVLLGAGNKFVFNDNTLLKKHGVSLAELLKLGEVGLMTIDNFISLDMHCEAHDKVAILYNSSVVATFENDSDTPSDIAFRQYKFTDIASVKFKVDAALIVGNQIVKCIITINMI